MLKTSGLKNPKQFVKGWVLDYMNVMGVTRAPLSYQYLTGLWALTSVVGRRGYLDVGGFRLYPPISIFLLGDSGVGKSMSLKYGLEKIIQVAVKDIDNYVAPSGPTLTERGIFLKWHGLQSKNGQEIEAAYMFEEALTLLNPRTGTETIAQQLIKLLDGSDWEDETGKYGSMKIKDICLSIAMGSVIDPIRDKISASDLIYGGFIYRLFITNEREWRKEIPRSENPDKFALADLAKRAIKIRNDCPEEFDITKTAIDFYEHLVNTSEDATYETSKMIGFYNRRASMCLKLGMGLALSEGVYEVTKEHLQRANKFLTLMKGVLESLILELEQPKAVRILFNVGDDLYKAGMRGMTRGKLMQKVGATSAAQANDRVQLLVDMDIAWKHEGKYYHNSLKNKLPEEVDNDHVPTSDVGGIGPEVDIPEVLGEGS